MARRRDYDDDEWEYRRATRRPYKSEETRIREAHAWTMIVLLLAMGIVPLLPFVLVAAFLFGVWLMP